jgi:hypothetical protein
MVGNSTFHYAYSRFPFSKAEPVIPSNQDKVAVVPIHAKNESKSSGQNIAY